MVDHHSTLGQSTFIDLLRSHLDEPLSSIRGSLSSEVRNGKVFWHDRYRIGTQTIKKPLGEENPELLNRMQRHEKVWTNRKKAQRRRAIMIRHLQVESYQTFDSTVGSLLSALSKVGFFRLGGMLAGTTAFKCYESVLGARFDTYKHDHREPVDFTDSNHVALTMQDARLPKLKKVLAELDFEHTPISHGRVKSRWRQSSSNTKVEFLSHSPDDLAWLFEIPALANGNRRSKLLYFLTNKSVQTVALYRGGVLVNVPRPERFAIYKLITAGRRINGQNQRRLQRDLLQSLWLTDVLAADRPEMLCKAFKDAVKIDSGYIDLIRNSINHEPRLRANLASINLKV